MKNIPIVILNKDRLNPLKLLVEALRIRNYNNIIIIDNESTYPELLEWYRQANVEVFYNNIPETLYDTGTFYRLAFEVNHTRFVDIVKNYYVFTDSDVVPDTCVPEDFIDHMVEICDNITNVNKIGLGLKIDDLPDYEFTKTIKEIELRYWKNKVIHNNIYEMYYAPIDTTFAVYKPNTFPLLADAYRMGGNYIAKHMPWYYDINNLPKDESYYIQHLKPNRGPVYSKLIKDLL